MRTKAQEWRRTRDSKRAEEQHCCSSKCSHFKEEGEEEVSWYTSSVPLVPPPSGETPWPSASQSIALCTPPRSSGPYAKWSCPWGRSQQGPPVALSSLCSHSRGAKLCGEGLARTCSVLLERNRCNGRLQPGDGVTPWVGVAPAQLGLICTESNACDTSMAFHLSAGQGKCTLCSRNMLFSSAFCFFWKIYLFSPSTLMLLK